MKRKKEEEEEESGFGVSLENMPGWKTFPRF